MARNLAELKELIESQDFLSVEQLAEAITTIRALAQKHGVVVGDPCRANPAELAAEQTAKRRYEYKYIAAPHLKLIAEEIRAFTDGERAGFRGLLVDLAPRHGKSETLSIWTPLWLLKRNPKTRIILASYGAEKAIEWGRKVRDFILANPDFGIVLNPGVLAASGWTTVQGGGMWTAGVGGPISGRGADCLAIGTLVTTDHGDIPIEQLVQSWYTHRVLSFNHETQQSEWRPIVAAREVKARGLLEVRTKAGRRIRCTPDHRFYVEGLGYREAALLSPGDRLISQAALPLQDQGMREMREAGACGVVLPPVLSGIEAALGSVALSYMQKGFREAGSGLRQSASAGTHQILLQSPLLLHTSGCKGEEALPNLRKAGESEGPSILQRALSSTEAQETQPAASSEGMHGVRNWLLSQDQPATVLYSRVCGSASLEANAGTGQFQVQSRAKQERAVQTDALSDLGTGWKALRGLSRSGQENADSPYQRGRERQLPRESSDTLRDSPRDSPQVESDTVSVVQWLCGEGEPVYDIQVEGTRNFFAEGLLVHNCLIVDDPYKDAAEAYSETIREKIRAWFNSVALTRLEPAGFIVVVHTRWHENDLISELDRASTDGTGIQMKHISFPALAEKEDILGRQLGDALWPDRFSVERLLEIKRGMSPYEWGALYQQNPTPEEGAAVKRVWWKFYPAHDIEKHYEQADQVILAFDLALKETEEGSYNVGMVLARKNATTRILDFWRERCDFPTSIAKARMWAIRYPRATAKIVEDKASGPALIATLMREIPGFIPMPAVGSKLIRLQAVIPLIHSGNVELPYMTDLAWSKEVVEECAAFPNGQHDDIVDTISHGLRYLYPSVWQHLDKMEREGAESLRDSEEWSLIADRTKQHAQSLKEIRKKAGELYSGEALVMHDARRDLC